MGKSSNNKKIVVTNVNRKSPVNEENTDKL